MRYVNYISIKLFKIPHLPEVITVNIFSKNNFQYTNAYVYICILQTIYICILYKIYIQKNSRVQWFTPVISAFCEAVAGELLEPRRQRLQ